MEETLSGWLHASSERNLLLVIGGRKSGVHFVAFNTLRPPFNSVLVRQAFAYAVDRQVIVDMAKKYKASNPSPATTLTPPGTLGRDLYNMANAMAGMWKTQLGVSVEVQAIAPPTFGNRLKDNPPEMYWLGWVADFNDPDNFLPGIFRSDSQYHYGKLTNSEFDKLVDSAAKVKTRQNVRNFIFKQNASYLKKKRR